MIKIKCCLFQRRMNSNEKIPDLLARKDIVEFCLGVL